MAALRIKSIMKKLFIAAILAAMPTISFAASLQHYQSGFRLIDGNQLNLMVDVVNNITGNGTASPVTASVFNAGNGTVAAPSFTFTSDTNTGLYRIGADNIGVAANGAKVLDIATTGLAVTGTLSATSTFTSAAIAVTSASANALVAGLAGATNPAFNVDASTASSATGLQIKSAAAASGLAVAVISSGTDESLTINAKGAGTVSINGTATGAITLGTATNITGAETITSASTTALTVGRLGATTPALQIDASTATSITGIKVKSAATGGGVAISAIGEASNGALTVDAQGSGTITLGGTSTGNIVMGRAVTGVSSSVTAGYTAMSGTAVPASAGAIAAGAPITMFSGGNKIWITSDTPSFSATKGDLCINTGGSSSSTRLYINNGTTSWIAITTAS